VGTAVDVSIGWARRNPDQGIEELLVEADRLMYLSKVAKRRTL
jgi:PleD family two-component response regulator